MSEEEKDIGKIMEEMLNRPLELIEENKKLKKKIEKLQKENGELDKENQRQAELLSNIHNKYRKENKNAEERNHSLGLNFIQIGEKLGLERFGIQTILLGIEKLQKENQELKGKLKGDNK